MNALVLLLFSAVFLNGGAANPAVDSDKELLQAIANGYVANRECVERCKATFVILEGEAANIEAARRGEIEDLVQAKGTYLLDGSRRKYERLYDPDAIKSHTFADPGGRLRASTGFLSIQMLTNGRSSLRYVPSYNPFTGGFDKRASIEESEGSRFSESMTFPLDLGSKEPYTSGIAYQLERARNHVHGLKVVKVEKNVPFEGRGVHVVTLEFDGGGYSYWIDYERGCVPLRILSRRDKEGDYYDDWYEHVALLGGKLWFPSRNVFYCYPTRRVKILEVGTIQIDPVIADADFELTFPEPVTILDKVHLRSYKNAASFALSRLDHPDKTASRLIGRPISVPLPVGAPVLPGAIESSRSWITYLGLSIASFLVVLVISRVVRAKRGSHVGGV